MLETLELKQLECFLNMLPIAAVVYDEDHKIIHTNLLAQKAFNKNTKFLLTRQIDKLLTNASIQQQSIQSQIMIDNQYYQFYVSPSIKEEKSYKAIVYFDWQISIQKDYEKYKEKSEDLEALFESAYDVMYVSDNKGNTLRVSSACKEFWGERREDLIGKNVIELEKQGVFKPSITRLVLEAGEKVSTIQTTKNNKRLLVVGTPIKDDNGEIIRVVNASRDITETERLQQEIESMKDQIEAYQLEIAQLQHSIQDEQELVYNSEKMKDVVVLAKKFANVNSTLLVQGESGVGKEVLVNYIHKISNRNDKPIVKINCSAIPDNLLEYELFGYEKEAFPGANIEGKKGLFELADEGTLFLDEISDISMSLQAKLLRVIQEGEIHCLGSAGPTKINVRIIVSSNKNLLEMVEKGLLREDLYYRLNVLPIKIPSLRERKEDIQVLSQHFLSQFNREFNRRKKLTSEQLQMLEKYHWPGNVRELRNIIERIVVMSNAQFVLEDVIALPTETVEDAVLVQQIMPLKECIELAEKKLLFLALQQYHSTTDIAKALKVNQSTISRKLTKLSMEIR
ncbi:sigma-54 interaction domain-containing protein [Lysinibacillus sp. NPDC056232]|uniref:sigma-54 interaction domain-containing protein n=1 Tax=Lysinibacillus sp. NPDC056232 TaxID=3345756 RepID=UPI0035DCAC7F